ncbi:hypothetical protein [Dactylosporangium sp. CA-139066]|uniref:hypothetical protein n=1 Tax=Dactylosporangium sp. CA-139066 TaxID=3239930 RepID=UPI003D8E2754
MNAFKSGVVMMELDPTRATWWQRAIAATALLSAAFATYLLIGSSNFVLVNAAAIALTLVTAVPLVCAGRRAFEAATLIGAVLLIVLAIPFVFFGAYFFLPSAALLLLARFTGRSRSARRFWTAAIAVLLVVVVAPWSAFIWDAMYRVPNLYVVYLPTDGRRPPRDTLLYDGSGIGYGATSVAITPLETGDKLYVGFRGDLSAAELTRLDHRLHELMPYATKIERCRSPKGC